MSIEKINYVWLVFHYETNKLTNLTGRREDKENSKASTVFKYTTASIKTFIDHNPDKINDIIVYTESVDPLVEKIKDGKSVILWEPEREISNTRPYWGWQKTTNYLDRPSNYWVYNDGIIGINKKQINEGIFKKSHDMCLDVWNNVDITDIPGRPSDYIPKRVFIAQQIAICFTCQDENLDLVESRKYFHHFYSNKLECLKYL